MRIGVLHHADDLSNDYAAYVSSLLDDTAGDNGYTVRDYEQLKRFREPLKENDVLLHIVLGASGKLSLKRWFNAKLPRIVKKYKLDKLVCMYGICVPSPVSQILLLPEKELANDDKKVFFWQEYAAKNLSKNVQRANCVVTYSNATRNAIEKKTGISSEKSIVLPYTVPEIFKPMEWHDKLYIKSRFADNKEYFVSVLPDDDEKMFTGLLKSFSKFKKWQQSNMLLLLLPKEESFSSSIEKKLDLYKYREDVKLINDADNRETADIIATAYALLHFSERDADLWPVAAALQCSTPLISFNRESIVEYCGDAALLAPETGHESFGDQVINVYKDENLRNKMSEAAAEHSKMYKRQEKATELWTLLKQA